jgi:hypothetical protein
VTEVSALTPKASAAAPANKPARDPMKRGNKWGTPNLRVVRTGQGANHRVDIAIQIRIGLEIHIRFPHIPYIPLPD